MAEAPERTGPELLPPAAEKDPVLGTGYSEAGAPSLLRAWCYLVWLSWQRQARARQMVWIALGLLVFAVALVAVNTAAGQWGMGHWRWPYRRGHTYAEWVNEVQVVLAAVHRSPEA